MGQNPKFSPIKCLQLFEFLEMFNSSPKVENNFYVSGTHYFKCLITVYTYTVYTVRHLQEKRFWLVSKSVALFCWPCQKGSLAAQLNGCTKLGLYCRPHFSSNITLSNNKHVSNAPEERNFPCRRENLCKL